MRLCSTHLNKIQCETSPEETLKRALKMQSRRTYRIRSSKYRRPACAHWLLLYSSYSPNLPPIIFSRPTTI
ncbi:hypothetical protein HETIRDRAFT_162896 [Heterobasidion irregulare TC 32-1]|uniref:Uncharacterized protein n=1 Tax=Heterobasidion irregulare (strain TC 32-1) TaxID=747525 RepID=W4JRE4_HETIT|nr:uncharacterized protein HETIRDRAFT_162896 [Heterobasidion irregulare TC 32-1]ETW76142.1 hypothetical protein HETIRDRAFT_162896 [Heterobasidion irregulare TC 32-1]